MNLNLNLIVSIDAWLYIFNMQTLMDKKRFDDVRRNSGILKKNSEVNILN